MIRLMLKQYIQPCILHFSLEINTTTLAFPVTITRRFKPFGTADFFRLLGDIAGFECVLLSFATILLTNTVNLFIILLHSLTPNLRFYHPTVR